MNYSELPDISSKLSKGTAAAAALYHDRCVESGGQDECFCYSDIFLKKLTNFVLEFGSKFGFSYKPWKQTNQIPRETPQRNNKRKKKLNFC